MKDIKQLVSDFTDALRSIGRSSKKDKTHASKIDNVFSSDKPNKVEAWDENGNPVEAYWDPEMSVKLAYQKMLNSSRYC